MDFSAFAAGTRTAKDLAPVYFFAGTEAWLRSQGVQILKAASEDLARSPIRLTSPESDWPSVAAELHTPSFFGGRKLVVFADEGNFIHNHAAAVKEYLAAPSPTAVLAALIPSEKLPGFAEGPSVRIVECRPLKPADRARWVQSEFQRLGKSCDRAAAEVLCRRAGEELSGLAGHVANLASYVGGRARITSEDVAGLVSGGAEREVYELALAAARKSPREAVEIAHALMSGGEAPQVLLWRLAWQYRKLIEAKKLILAGRRRFEVTSLLQITYYPDEFLKLVDDHSLQELLAKHGDILGADISLKTGGGQEQAIMESLVLRLAA